MDSTERYLLYSVNVTVVADEHDAMIVNPTLMVASEIVSKDQRVIKSSSALFESTVLYEKMEWKIDSSRLSVREFCEGKFKSEYLIYDMVSDYVSKFSYIAYKNFGLNYFLVVMKDDPGTWLKRRFLPGNLQADGKNKIYVQPEIVFDMGDKVKCKFELSVGDVTLEGVEGKDNGIFVRVNMDHRDTSVEDIQKQLKEWKEKQDIVISLLDKIFAEKK